MFRFHRSMTRPFFSRDRISDFENFTRHADDVISQMRDRLRSGHAVDFQVLIPKFTRTLVLMLTHLQDAVSRFTLDSASEFLFGKDVQSLSTGLPYPHHIAGTHASRSTPSETFAVAVSESQEALSQRLRTGTHICCVFRRLSSCCNQVGFGPCLRSSRITLPSP